MIIVAISQIFWYTQIKNSKKEMIQLSGKDTINALRNMYSSENRYNMFGNVLLSMEVSGFRGVSGKLSFDFPITVIVGKNGSGKSTLAQLALCCFRYKPIERTVRDSKDYYNLGSFFIKSNLGPNPYTSEAFMRYSYAVSNDSRGFEQMSFFPPESGCKARENVLRKGKEKWSGYRSRPERKCIYFGMGFFVPHHEMGDRIYLDPKTSIAAKRDFSADAQRYAREILGISYDRIEVDTILNQTRSAEMGFASRYGSSYSENHMGCGEGRLLRMIDSIETAPERSLLHSQDS